jgi:hypothetical protein
MCYRLLEQPGYLRTRSRKNSLWARGYQLSCGGYGGKRKRAAEQECTVSEADTHDVAHAWLALLPPGVHSLSMRLQVTHVRSFLCTVPLVVRVRHLSFCTTCVECISCLLSTECDASMPRDLPFTSTIAFWHASYRHWPVIAIPQAISWPTKVEVMSMPCCSKSLSCDRHRAA